MIEVVPGAGEGEADVLVVVYEALQVVVTIEPVPETAVDAADAVVLTHIGMEVVVVVLYVMKVGQVVGLITVMGDVPVVIPV